MALGRHNPSRYLSVTLMLMVLGAVPVHFAHADGVPASCTSSCADKRDQCKVKACTKAGGHTQLHQGACYNLQGTSQQAYAAGVAKCTTKAQSCMSRCK
jgi:hypothetical protein